jgi:biopolymer transport protein ExbD
MARQRGDVAGSSTGINMTPLIDVLLVLLDDQRL